MELSSHRLCPGERLIAWYDGRLKLVEVALEGLGGLESVAGARTATTGPLERRELLVGGASRQFAVSGMVESRGRTHPPVEAAPKAQREFFFVPA